MIAHPVGPGLGPEDAGAQGERAHIDAQLRRTLDQIGEIARRAAECGDAEVADQHDLTVAVAARDGDHGRPEGFRAVVGAESAGEESVAEGVLQDVAAVQPAAGEGARHDLGPDSDVLACVGDDDRLAGGAGGGMQPDHVAHGRGKEPKGVGVAQVGLDREGELLDVFDPLNRVRGQVALLHPGAKEGDVVVGERYDRTKPSQLHLLQRRLRQEIGRAGRVETALGVVPELCQHLGPLLNRARRGL